MIMLSMDKKIIKGSYMMLFNKEKWKLGNKLWKV